MTHAKLMLALPPIAGGRRRHQLIGLLSCLAQEAALAYDAAARRIRGAAAICNFNEQETEELIALYGAPTLPEESAGG